MNHFYMLPERAFRPIGGRMTCEGGGKGSSPPPAPDYRGAAAESAQASKEIATQQNFANRPTQITPWGRTDWSSAAGTDPSTGQAITNWTQTQSLSPVSQQALDSQLAMQKGRSDLAQGFQGRVGEAYKDPFSYEGMTNLAQRPGQTTQSTSEGGIASERQRIEGALFDRMAPEHQRAQSRLDQQLANQGITEGSEAYQMARQELGDQQARERFNALTMGGQEQARMQQMMLAQQGQAYGQDMSGSQYQNQLRQAQIAEEAQRRGMSLNEMNALMTGQQVQSPQMPGFIGAASGQAPNYLGAASAQYQSGLDAYNANQAQGQGAMSGIMGAAGTVLGSIYGGPMGGTAGGAAGQSLGRMFG